MGGRGATSGTSNSGKPYGTEYHTVLEMDNIKILSRNINPPVLPQETMSSAKGRVYAVGNSKGGLKSIGFYAKDGRLRRQIDIDHTHGGRRPHVHEGYEHLPEIANLSKSDTAYIRKVTRLWKSM